MKIILPDDAMNSFERRVQLFVDRTFFHFMERGRYGMQVAAEEIVDTVADIRSPELRAKVIAQVTILLVDEFIRRGTQGLTAAVHLAHTVIHNMINDSVQPRDRMQGVGAWPNR